LKQLCILNIKCMKVQALSTTKTTCYHCGEACSAAIIQFDSKEFCCAGCKSVYEILSENNMCNYYSITQNPGITQQRTHLNTYFDFLDEPHVIDQLSHFKEGSQVHVKFTIPNMHCSSCIWLLENLYKLNPGVISSRVVFLDKEITIVYDSEKTSLKEVVILLKKIGYEPSLSFEDLNERNARKVNRTQIYKIGIAGFCFGNIMMLSFPDYFADGNFLNNQLLNKVFNYTSLALSLPVFFYCAQEFWVSSWQQLKLRKLNIDIPIAFAILVTFLVSVYQIVIKGQLGFLDSMSGIVFFMLLGRFFQNRSYHYLTFQRNFSSYLPIAVNKLSGGREKNVPISDIAVGDEIVMRQQEIVPTDGILMSDDAWFDYSFVTGESNWIQKHKNEVIYAGAIQQSPISNLKVSKSPSTSYITQLWNSKKNPKFVSNTLLTTERINVYFSAIVLLLGTLASVYWIWQHEYTTGLRALITVWIVACPCALLLCSTFTYGNMLSILAHNGMYIKNAAVLEKMKQIDTLIFDKTGTITTTQNNEVDFVGRELTLDEVSAIASLSNLSIHPLSKSISTYLNDVEIRLVNDFQSFDGKGIQGYVNGSFVRMGSETWLNITSASSTHFTKVFVQIKDEVVGYFEVKNKYRGNVLTEMSTLKNDYDLHLLSGDNDAEKDNLRSLFEHESHLNFNQLPEQKTAYIRKLQDRGNTVMMIGDGLNDANAFERSDVGVAVIENENNFLPACDVILRADSMSQFSSLMTYVKHSKTILYITFAVSIIYNIIGLSFAMRGELKPVVAAILMPISTVSVVGLSYILSRYLALRTKLKT
jgi:Cu+-exporting ATPase